MMDILAKQRRRLEKITVNVCVDGKGREAAEIALHYMNLAEKLQQELEEHKKWGGQAVKDLNRQEDMLEKYRDMLKRLEWVDDEQSNARCRICGNSWEHAPGCELAAMLNELCEEHGLSRPHPQLVPAIRCRIRAYIEDHV